MVTPDTLVLINQFNGYMAEMNNSNNEYDLNYCYGRLVGWLALAVYLLPDQIFRELHNECFDAYNKILDSKDELLF